MNKKILLGLCSVFLIVALLLSSVTAAGDVAVWNVLKVNGEWSTTQDTVTIIAGETVTFKVVTNAENKYNLDVSVLDKDKKLIQYLLKAADLEGNYNKELSYTPASAGTYYIFSQAYSTNSDDSSQLTVIVKDKVPPACPDADGDGVCNDKDNCDTNKNADQLDTDKDGAGNVCDDDDDGDGVKDPTDNCPLFANPAQEDKDKDGIGDACDSDWDGDNVPNSKDNCAKTYNPTQSDFDGDGWGDACDTDDDNDGVIDEWDKCPTEKGTKDNNGCPKVEPTVNKAPIMDNIDAHNKNVKEGNSLSFTVSAEDDGIPQRLTYEVEKVTSGSFFSFSNALDNLWKFWMNDQLPSYAKFDETTNTFTIAPSYNFVVHPDLSEKVMFKFRAYDGDKYSAWEYVNINVVDVNQNPVISSTEVPGVATVGDTITFKASATDADGDKLTYNWKFGEAVASGSEVSTTLIKVGIFTVSLTVTDEFGGSVKYSHMLGVAPVQLPDTDGDGVPDADDNCPDKANADQKDTDEDGIGDVCDEVIPVDNDKDDDGITDDKDNCPAVANPTQSDIDGDGIGDVCDEVIPVDNDKDDDGITDDKDNCPAVANPTQSDVDGDGFGDACDEVITPVELGCTDSNAYNYDENATIDDNSCRYKVVGCTDPAALNYYAQATFSGECKYSNPKTGLFIKKAHFTPDEVSAGDYLVLSTSIVNDWDVDWKDMRVTVFIYELGVKISGKEFNLDSGEQHNQNLFVPLPGETEPGQYLVEITVGNSKVHETTYREVTVY